MEQFNRRRNNALALELGNRVANVFYRILVDRNTSSDLDAWGRCAGKHDPQFAATGDFLVFGSG